MKTSNHIFDNITQIELPANLKAAVLERVREAREREIRAKKARYSAGFIFLGVSAILSGVVFGKELVGSEFWSIASLGFTDANVLLVHWQEFGYSLLETFPSVAVASLLAPVFIFMVLMKKYVEQRSVLELKF